MQPQTDPNKIKLTNVRLSYPNLFTPREPEPGKPPEFSASLILDKVKDRAQIEALEKLIDRVALDKFRRKMGLKHRGLRDGNEKADRDGYGDEVMFITAKAKKDRRPVVVDADKTPLVDGDPKPYAGCYVNASVRAFAYDHATGGKGVGFGLLAIQFVKDGPSFGAAPVDADAEFEDVSGEASTVEDY